MALRCLDRTCSHSFLTLVCKDLQGKPQETEAGYALGQEKCLRKEPLFKSFLFFIFYPVMRLYNSVSLSPDGESLPLRFCSCLWGLFFKAHQRAPSQVFCTGSSEEPLLTSDQKSVSSFPPRNWCGRWHSATLLPLRGPVAHSVFFLPDLEGVMQMPCFWLSLQQFSSLWQLWVCINCCPLKKETALISIF